MGRGREFPVATSHSIGLPASPPPVTSDFPSGAKTRAPAHQAVVRVHKLVRVSTSQSFNVLSEMQASSVPSVENASEWIELVCSLSVPSNCLVVRFHSLMVPWSVPVARTFVPVGEKAEVVM